MASQETEALQKKIREQEAEIQRLRGLLDQAGISWKQEADGEKKEDAVRFDRASYEAEQGARIRQEPIDRKHVQVFFTYFRGRTDAYELRSGKPSAKTGKYGYYYQCENFWKAGLCPKRDSRSFSCRKCAHRSDRALKGETVMAHLQGRAADCSDVIGMYPIRKDGTCCFLVFDFDDHDADPDTVEAGREWQREADAVRRMCRVHEIPCLTERSRSGNGAHIWLFFEEPIPARLARQFGACIITEGAKSVGKPSFQYYDRMIPLQDSLPKNGYGNVIALPLQGRALKKGCSAFVDENWDAFPDQWKALCDTKKIPTAFVQEKIAEWGGNGVFGLLSKEEDTDTESRKQKGTPWQKAELSPRDAKGTVDLVLADRLYIDRSGISDALADTLRRTAAFQNPEYYKKLAQGFSTKGTPYIVWCGEERDGYLALPRGCREDVQEILDGAGIPYALQDKRNQGRPIHVSFRGTLRPEQQKAADEMLQYDNGILAAATAFGKTVVGAYFIAARKVNTLILVHNTEILENWLTDLSRFLEIREPLPEYRTRTGRTKTRSSLIGVKKGAKDTLTGIVDVAMIRSLGKPGEISDVVKQYGMVIMDECHHAGAATMEAVMREVNARYIYGMTATPKRDDGQEKRVYMQFGGVRSRYTAKERARAQHIAHCLIPRFTAFVTADPENIRFQDAEKQMAESGIRNAQIVRDVKECVKKGRTPLVVTQRVEHADQLAEMLSDAADHVFVLTGGKKKQEKEALRAQLRSVPDAESVILIATGQYIGEGFNFPRLDTMMLAMPISWEGNVEQYAGRLHRDYAGKKDVLIYDYVDVRIRSLEHMYQKRLAAYRRIGYTIAGSPDEKTQAEGHFYDETDFQERFRKDILEAGKEILIVSPGIGRNGTEAFLKAAMPPMERGVPVVVHAMDPAGFSEEAGAFAQEAGKRLEEAGASVRYHEKLHEHFAVIDRRVVWYGTINLLSTPHKEQSMMRVESEEIGAELLALAAKEEKGAGNV